MLSAVGQNSGMTVCPCHGKCRISAGLSIMAAVAELGEIAITATVVLLDLRSGAGGSVADGVTGRASRSVETDIVYMSLSAALTLVFLIANIVGMHQLLAGASPPAVSTTQRPHPRGHCCVGCAEPVCSLCWCSARWEPPRGTRLGV